MNFDLNPEQQRLQALARQVAEERIKPYATDVDLNERYPTEGLRALAEAGLCGLTITQDYGGLAADAVSSVLVIEEISRACTSTGALMLTYGGSVLSIMAYGTSAQKEKYLPGIARGEVSLSFSLTEDHCGSDAAAIRSTAERNGDHWTLNGKKAWTGNAARADVIVTAAKTDPNARGSGVSIFLIEKGTPGVSIGEIYSKTGARGTIHSEVIFDNAQVPAANLLGEVGRGFAQMMHSLDFSQCRTARCLLSRLSWCPPPGALQKQPRISGQIHLTRPGIHAFELQQPELEVTGQRFTRPAASQHLTDTGPEPEQPLVLLVVG